MDDNFVKGSIAVNATSTKVWEVLTNPDKILQYLGSKIKTDWKVGSGITWEGELFGVKFKNKGKVLKNEPGRILQYTYWSGLGGDEDLPENYSEITWTLDENSDESVNLTYSRLNIPTPMEQEIFKSHLPMMLEEIKNLAEGL